MMTKPKLFTASLSLKLFYRELKIAENKHSLLSSKYTQSTTACCNCLSDGNLRYFLLKKYSGNVISVIIDKLEIEAMAIERFLEEGTSYPTIYDIFLRLRSDAKFPTKSCNITSLHLFKRFR